MAIRTIRAAQFMYYIPTGETRHRKDGTDEDILSVRHALHGDTVDIPRDEDIQRGERAGSFVQAVEEDQLADDEVEVDAFTSHDTLVSWFEDTDPTAKQVIAAADNDPDKAEMLLAAEDTATGGQSRKSVVAALNRIIDNAEEDEEE